MCGLRHVRDRMPAWRLLPSTSKSPDSGSGWLHGMRRLRQKLSDPGHRCDSRSGLCRVYYSDLDQRQACRCLRQFGLLLMIKFFSAEFAEKNFSGSDFLRGNIRPNTLPRTSNQKQANSIILTVDPRRLCLLPDGDPHQILKSVPPGLNRPANAQCVLPAEDASKTGSLNSFPKAD